VRSSIFLLASQHLACGVVNDRRFFSAGEGDPAHGLERPTAVPPPSAGARRFQTLPTVMLDAYASLPRAR
jgi:hypothetical protein